VAASQNVRYVILFSRTYDIFSVDKSTPVYEVTSVARKSYFTFHFILCYILFVSVLLFFKLLLDQQLKSGMCLSGGGYRATVFHIGALRRLVNFVFLLLLLF
jgi:hypothetical protein